MTLLGTILTDDAVLFASDSGERQVDRSSDAVRHLPKAKVEQLGDRAVLWAYIGDGERGDALAEWLRENADALADDWKQAIALVHNKIVEIHHRSEWVHLPQMGALFAGWMGAVQDFWWISPGGISMPLGLRNHMRDKNPFFVGMGCVAAEVGYAAAKLTDANAEESVLFEIAMDATIHTLDDLRIANSHAVHPLTVAQVTEDAALDEIRGHVEIRPGRVSRNQADHD